MAKLTLQIVGSTTGQPDSIDTVIQRVKADLAQIGKEPIKIKIETEGDVKALQAAARLEKATADRIRTENKLKIAKEQTKQAEQASNREKEKTIQLEKQATLEIRRRETEEQRRKTAIKQGETAEKQASLATEKAAEAEKKRTLSIQQAKTAIEQRRLQEERTRTAVENHAAADAKAKAAADNKSAAETRAAAAVEKRAASEKNAASATKTLGTETERTAKQTESLWDNFQKFARWYIIGNAFSSIVRSMREALDTMKAVDDELVTIRKVTGFSDAQISGIRERAYSTASEYGVGAADYLQSVAAFSRAGYKEQAAALAELSTKTQIVGDTTAEVANQFLLSVDAAYKYKGSVEALTAVLDGSNAIDNLYATSIEKIAEGLGTVAPVAAQMHVGVNELAAAIGTITAVTQRTGTEAARALRAIMLNIVGDTKTEIDEGVTWTTGEIAGLRDVIKQYAPEAYKAAEATGSIIDPMEAIGGLAKSMQEGLLTEQKLMEMVSDIGGKLRSSQLLALIQNWDMYQSMLTDYAGAIGSADKEVENALNSWTRKTNQLKNAWAEFISHLIDSKAIKAGVDLLTGLVKVLDSGVGFVAVFTAGIVGLAAAFAKLLPIIEGINFAFLSSPLFIVGVVAAATAGIIKLIDSITHAYERQVEKVKELQAEYDNLYGDSGELQSLISRIGDLTEEEVNRLGVLQSQRQELEEQLKLEKELTFVEWRKTQNTKEWEVDPYTGVAAIEKPVNLTEQVLTGAKNALYQLHAEMDAGQHTQEGYINGLKRIVSSLQTSAEAIKGGKDAGKELSETEAALLALYELLSGEIGKYTVETEINTNAKQDNADATEDDTEANKILAKAMEEVEKKSSLTYGTLAELEKLYPGLSARILDANGNLTDEGKAALETKAALFELVSSMVTANTTALNFDSQIEKLYDLALAAGVAGTALDGIFGDVTGGPSFSADGTLDVNAEKSYIRKKNNASRTLNSLIQDVKNELKKTDYIGGGGGGGGGGGSSKTAAELEKEAQQEYLKGLKQIVADEKARYALMEAQGAATAELNAQADVIQAKLHDQAEYMRQIEESYSDVAAISKEWWDWEEKKAKRIEDDENALEKAAEEEKKAAEDAQKAELQTYKDKVDHWKAELSFLEASGASDKERIAAMHRIQRALQKQAEYMRSIEADEDDIRALSTEWWNIQNKILELTEKTAQTLRDQIAETLGDIVDSLEAAAEEMSAPLQAELDALNAQHDAVADRREEEEKILAVQQARIALENAQKERNIRQYNAASGQWEWVANAKEVEKAQKDLTDAQTDLAKYYADKTYEAAKENLEKQISSTKSAFDALKDALNEAAKAIKDGSMSYAEAYDYIKGKMQEIYDEYGIDLKHTLKNAGAELVDGIAELFEDERISDDVREKTVKAVGAILDNAETAADNLSLFSQYIRNALQSDNPADAIGELSDAIRSGTVKNLNDLSAILKALNGEYEGISLATARTWALSKMQANSIAWHMTDDQATRDALHAQNVQLGTSMGLEYAHGKWYDAEGNQVYTLSNVGGDWSSSLNTALQSVIDLINNAVSSAGSGSSAAPSAGNSESGATESPSSTSTYRNGLPGKVDKMKDSGYSDSEIMRALIYEGASSGEIARYIATSKFDTGGILHGYGGIKATSEDEIVLPPGMTRAMLDAERSGSFEALLNHMGIVVGAANMLNTGGSRTTRSMIGTQNNGDLYQFGNVTLTEQQARGMTVYQLAQLGRTLALQRGG